MLNSLVVRALAAQISEDSKYPNVCAMLKHPFCMNVFIRDRHLGILGISSDNTTTIKRGST